MWRGMRSRQKDELPGNRPNSCPRPEILQRGDGRRMDEQLANVCGHLDCENPAVIIAEPAADCLSIGNMKVRGSVILVVNLFQPFST